jgi:hypothetical protein
MNWQQIFHSLTPAERQEFTRLLLQRIERPRRSRLRGLRDLRPAHLLLPSVLAQVTLFIWVMWHPTGNFFGTLMTGNLIIAALSILPSEFVRPRQSAHWVRPIY